MKRLDTLLESAKDIGAEFDRERARQYLASDRGLQALEEMNLDEKLQPLDQETSAGLERLLGDMLTTAEEENRAIDREEAEEAQEAQESRTTGQ